MFKRELKINLKSFLIWSLVMVALLFLVFMIYPSISSSMKLDELMSVFPQEILKSFNFDIVSISTSFGWYASEGFMITVLVGGLYAGMLGANILLKEENDKTISFLFSVPVSRFKILTSKILVGLTYIVLFNFIILIVTGLGFSLNDDMEVKKWLLMTLSPIIVHMLIFFISLFISLFMHKTSKCVSLVMGLIMLFYALNIIAKISENFSFLKYLTPFGYVDTASIIKNATLEISSLIAIIISLVFILLSYIRYNKKELL